jgi:hypothetical protein
MQPVPLKGHNREVGRDQGFVPLCLRDTFTFDEGTQQQYPCMETAFLPTKEQIVKLIAGEPLILRILGTKWPPVSIEVGDDITPEELAELKKYHVKLRAQRAIANLKNGSGIKSTLHK